MTTSAKSHRTDIHIQSDDEYSSVVQNEGNRNNDLI
jgi:hypothetical protein